MAHAAGSPGELPESAMQLQEVEAELAEVEAHIESLMARQSKLMEQRERLRRTIQADQRAPRADWRHGSFAWDAKVSQLLHDVFRLEGGFRPLQREVINATMQGRDVLCLLPSGSGKSVCYQLPALAQDGLTLVISPLLSLIHDQVLALKALGIPAAGWTSMTGKEEAAALLAALDPKAWQQRQQTTSGGKSASAPSAPPLRLLYVTPEKVVASKRLMAKLEKLAAGGLLCRIAVDEAHCCSVLGNDFRPDYKKLGVLKQQFPAVPLLALTATATQAVVQDLKSILRIDGCELFRLSVDRPNLFYSVRHKPAAAADVTADMVAWIRVHCPPAGRGSRLGPGGGIVYCLSRKETEVLAAELVEAGLSAAHYHADMEAADRLRAHEAWSRGDVQIMVATTAFGMGVSRADVRFVIHHSLSKSAENYYQESSRAGRDGLPAHCLLYFRFSDVLRQAGVVCFEPTWHANLMAVTRYAAAVGSCRRAAIAAHFSEAPPECRGMCDCCAATSSGCGGGGGGGSAVESSDVRAAAVSVLRTLRGITDKEKKATLLQLLAAWKGGASGAGGAATAAVLDREASEALVLHMLLTGLLDFEFGHTAYATNVYLRCSRRGISLLEASGGGAAGSSAGGGSSGPEVIMRSWAPAARLLLEELAMGEPGQSGQSTAGGASSRSQAAESQQHSPQLHALQAWRQHEADQARVFPHAIATWRQLEQLAALQPGLTSLQPQEQQEKLVAVLGRQRAERHGAAILQVVQQVASGTTFVPPASLLRPTNGGSSSTAVTAQRPGSSSQLRTAAAAARTPTAGISPQGPRPQQQDAAAEVVIISSDDGSGDFDTDGDGGGDGAVDDGDSDDDDFDDVPLRKRAKR